MFKMNLEYVELIYKVCYTRNIVLFIDDYSRKNGTYFLVEKLDALTSFKYFKKML